MSNQVYSLIMHSDENFWKTDEHPVDFPRDRFLEYTSDSVKEEYQDLNSETIEKLKRISVLFATEHEKTDTKFGKITNIEVLPKILRLSFKFNKRNPILKGTLNAEELQINAQGYEFYRTHWAIKEANIFDYLKKRDASIEGVLDEMKSNLDTLHPTSPNKINIITLYAHNGSGKTRLSKLLQDNYEDQVICYNAFLEDSFYWDNEELELHINTNSWVFKLIQQEELNNKINEIFQELTDAKIEVDININTPDKNDKETKAGKVTFNNLTDDATKYNIKISKGEESLFIWSVFYSILNRGKELLSEKEEDRSTNLFNDKKYIIIDDPVSSMDDEKIITVALKILEFIKKSKNKFQFLITTHHPLFFNVLFNKTHKTWNKKNYVLSKTANGLKLIPQENESPFAYHHIVINEIQNAIDNNNIKKYHFNLLRALLEKTANFIGYKNWKSCLNGIDIKDDFLKLIDHYSHDKLSELEYNNLMEKQIETYIDVFQKFIEKYKFKEQEDQNHEQ